MDKLLHNNTNIKIRDLMNEISPNLEREEIEKALAKISQKSVFLGFDAFIDVTATPIKKRQWSQVARVFRDYKRVGHFYQ